MFDLEHRSYSLHFILLFFFHTFIFLRLFYVDHFKVLIEFAVNTIVHHFYVWFFGPEGCGILAPKPGIKPALEGKVLNTGRPGKSPYF